MNKMPNILLNNYCNLDCDYCFANEVRGEDAQKLSMDDYRRILDLLEKSGIPEVRLIGGEPTLHPKFPEFVLEASRRDSIRKVHLFTNGSFKSRYTELLKLVAQRNEDVSVLMNFNDPHTAGETNFEAMEQNVDQLANTPISLRLGINFYKENQDYDHLLDVAEKYNLPNLRWALTIPQDVSAIDPENYFDQHADMIFNFLMEAADRGMAPSPDCTSLPVCALSDDQIREMSLTGEGNLRTRACDPIIDIKPDMTAIRCFAMDDYAVDVDKFNTIQELRKHFTKNVDEKYRNKPLLDRCETCTHFQNEGQTCACLSYYNE